MKAAALAMALLSAAFLVALVAGVFADSARRAELRSPQPTSGMALLDGWPCRRAEKKEVHLRGVEDDYSSLGAEPAASPEVRLAAGVEAHLAHTDYDQAIVDSAIVDAFALPSRIASGVLVVRVRALDRRDNDAIAVGDFSVAGAFAERPIFYANFNRLADLGGWRRSGDLVWASFAEVRLKSGDTLLDYVRASAGGRSIGVKIGDDSIVDFMGAAVCLEPSGKAGLTYAYSALTANREADLAAFSCQTEGSLRCDPFAGDRPCDSLLPLLCFRDSAAPAPRVLSRGDKMFEALRRWSGGEVAATAPVSALAFATIAEADGACAAEFGAGWRVADWHLGGVGASFTALSGGRSFSGRYWIDIKDQPYATCWSRDHGA